MGIIIHQSLYGDLDGGYGLLKTTIPDIKLAKKFGNSTDLSDRPSPGVVWHPAIRGFKLGAYYLIMKTYNTPQFRTGRVFSHVLAIENKDLSTIQDLGQLFGLFNDVLTVDIDLAPYEYIIRPVFKINTDANRIKCAADGLTKGKTVVWIGQDGFEDVLKTIWPNLWRKAKQEFQFGIQFNPTAVSPAAINIFCTPESLAVKWHDPEYLVINKDERAKPVSLAAEYILNKENAQPLKVFLSDIGKEPDNLKQLILLEKGLDTYTNLSRVNDFNELFSLYNILFTFNTGNRKLLENILSRIGDVIPNGSMQAVNALRKVKTQNINADVFLKLKSGVKKWLDVNLFNPSYSRVSDVYKLIINIKSPDSENWWSDLVLRSLEDHLAQWKEYFGQLVWGWIDAEVENIFDIIGKLIIANNGLAEKLASAFPKTLKDDTADYLIGFSKKHSLLILHASSLVYKLKADKIIREQLKIDTDKTYDKALLLISNEIKPEEFIKSSLTEDDSRLENICGQLIKKKKALLKDFDVTNLVWQKIVLKIGLRSDEIQVYFSKPYSSLVYPLLDLVLTEQPVQQELLLLIAESNFSDIVDYKNRKEIWKFLDAPVKNRFLQRTALRLLENPTILTETIEDDLDKALSSQSVVSAYLEKYKDDISRVIQFFNSRTDLSEKSLQDYLYYYRGSLNAVEATQIGKLIFSKNWKNCLGIIRDRARSNATYKIAFQECTSLLGWFAYGQAVMQGLISKIEVNESDWWEEFEQLAPRLYPEGPTDKKVWKKAGGEEADLLHRGDGREIWKDAINKLKFGRISNTFLGVLLDRMSKDFPYNEQLNILISLRNRI
jgi:hypothetical protein